MVKNSKKEVSMEDMEAVCPSDAQRAAWRRCLSVIPADLETLLNELDNENLD